MKIGKLEKDVEMPPRQARYKHYEWDTMEVGDSFEIEWEPSDFKDKKRKPSQIRGSIRGSLMSSARKHSQRKHQGQREYVSRMTEKGFRIWRIK